MQQQRLIQTRGRPSHHYPYLLQLSPPVAFIYFFFFCLLLSSCTPASAFFIVPSPTYTPTRRPSTTTTTTTMSTDTPPPPPPHILSTLHPSNHLLELTLNRPKALNALSVQMLHDLTQHIKRALTDESIQGVLLTAVEGSRAFSAGGDIKEILQGRLTEKEDKAKKEGCDPKTYIRVEYELDSLIHKLSREKPVVAVCNEGIVMGGGAGVFEGAGLRVVTPGCTYAMPECRIAILPDAGAMGYLITRTPGEVPLYCALTGARLTGNCMKYTGLATHLIENPAEDIPTLLREIRTRPVAEMAAILDEGERRSAGGGEGANAAAPIAARLPLINTLFGSEGKKSSVTDIYNAIKTHLEKHKQEEDEWLHTALQDLETECPASHVITLHAIRTAQSFLVGAAPAASQNGQQNGGTEKKGKEGWNIDQGLGIEYIANCCLGFRKDFIEGVSTAVGARKGETPAWTHKSWEDAEKDAEIIQLKEKMAEGKSFWDLI